MTDTLAAFAEEARGRVDDALGRYLPAPPACPSLISEAVRYSVFAGGKRLRPLLALAAADACAAAEDADRTRAFDHALPGACAVELIHTYSLIHDDLPAMDDDTLRRGRPTLHVVYGDGMAILAGDALQAEAFGLMAREPADTAPDVATRKLRALQIVAEAAGSVGMVGGQALDLQAAGQVKGHSLALDADGLRGVHARKTGALIRASAWAGAVMGGASLSAERAVAAWGEHVGLAFQIVDDILDVEGNAGELGKTVGKDAARDKPTYPALFGLDRSKAMAAECRDHARAMLRDAGLTRGHLDAMADWVITRKN
ncbi:MAG TPA: farnesyl diphosphate synthase [Vicinamibacterales bacterium]|jgi:geranylgeranyl diphosphate synthase type II|nr:farnesyl diphosphate synthase [Vicinamibacterales bacterium]